MKNQFRIGIDMDGVLCNFVKGLVNSFNVRYIEKMSVEDITTWELDPRLKEIYVKSPSIFKNLEPMADAIEIFNKLNEDFELYIVTDTNGCNEIYKYKYEWIQKHLPDFDMRRFIPISNKSLLRLDVLFDDAPHHLELDEETIKIAMTTPYNEHCDPDFRVDDWKGFYKTIGLLLAKYLDEDPIVHKHIRQAFTND